MTQLNHLSDREEAILNEWLSWTLNASATTEDALTLAKRAIQWTLSAYDEGARAAPAWLILLLGLALSPSRHDQEALKRLISSTDEATPLSNDGLRPLFTSSPSRSRSTLLHLTQSWITPFLSSERGRQVTSKLVELSDPLESQLIGFCIHALLEPYTLEDLLPPWDLTTLSLGYRSPQLMARLLRASHQAESPPPHEDERERDTLFLVCERLAAQPLGRHLLRRDSYFLAVLLSFEALQTTTRRLLFTRLSSCLTSLGPPSLRLNPSRNQSVSGMNDHAEQTAVTGALSSLTRSGPLERVIRSELIYMDEQLCSGVDHFSWRLAQGELLYFRRRDQLDYATQWDWSWHFHRPDLLALGGTGLSLLCLAHLSSVWVQRALSSSLKGDIRALWSWEEYPSAPLSRVEEEIDLLKLLTQSDRSAGLMHLQAERAHFHPQLTFTWTMDPTRRSQEEICLCFREMELSATIPKSLRARLRLPEILSSETLLESRHLSQHEPPWIEEKLSQTNSTADVHMPTHLDQSIDRLRAYTSVVRHILNAWLSR